MGLFLIISGIILLVAGVRNTQGTLYSLLESDFTGSNNFIEFLVAIIIVGALGYIPKLRSTSIALMSLIIVVIFLRQGTGFFSQLQSSLTSVSNSSPTTAATTASTTAATVAGNLNNASTYTY